MTNVSLRKLPKQARALARFELILDHAEAMISETGFENLKMNDLARRAEVNIASIYQYFPNRAVVARAIVERHFEAYRKELNENLGIFYSGVSASADAMETVNELIDNILTHYYQFLKDRPTFFSTWGTVRGNPDFMELNMADSKANAAILAEAMIGSGVNVDKKELNQALFLVCELTEPFMQTLMHSKPSEVKGLMKHYKLMLSQYFLALE